VQHHYSGHWKGLALKISTSNAPRNDVALLKTITYRAIKTTGTLIVIVSRHRQIFKPREKGFCRVTPFWSTILLR
jgi:hypothetical protein